MARTKITAPTRLGINNLVLNGDFEYAPTFVAATTANTVWVDGSAAGSATNGRYGWGMGGGGQAGSWAAQFDNSISNSGTYSMKLSTKASASSVIIGRMIANTTAGLVYGIGVLTVSVSYTWSVWMKTTVNSGSATSGAFVIFKTRNSSGSTVTSANTTKVNTTTGWTKYTGTITPGATSVVFDVQLSITGSDGTGTLIMDAWFDDVQLGLTASRTRSLASGRSASGSRTAA